MLPHRWWWPDYIREMLSLVHRRHELIKLIIAIGLYLLQEIIHLQSLPVTGYFPSSQNILCLLRDAHVVWMNLVLQGIFLAWDYLTLISLLSIAADSGVTCIIQICNGGSEGCVAWYLTFCDAGESQTPVVLGLRTTALNAIGALGPSGGSFSCIHKKARVCQEIVSVLLQVSIVCTLIHKCRVDTLAQSLLLLWLPLALLFSTRHIARSNHKGALIRWSWTLFIRWEETHCWGVRFLVGKKWWVCLERVSESVTCLRCYHWGVVASTELRDLKEVVCQRILLGNVRAIANFTWGVMSVNKISFIIVWLCTALVPLFR